MTKQKTIRMMKNGTVYKSMEEIKLAKARLKYESRLYEERLKNSRDLIFAGFSFSLKSLGLNIRNRLIGYSLFRSLYKSNIFYDFIGNFSKGFRQYR